MFTDQLLLWLQPGSIIVIPPEPTETFDGDSFFLAATLGGSLGVFNVFRDVDGFDAREQSLMDFSLTGSWTQEEIWYGNYRYPWGP